MSVPDESDPESEPDPSEVGGWGPWCGPLHLVERAIAGQRFACYFVVDHFMFMGVVQRRGRPDIVLNKHGHTRRYLNLDADGHAYRYLPGPPDSTRLGQYRPHRDLVAAIDHLHLHELPWLGFSGFDHERHGLAYGDRWHHPEVRAWEQRWATHQRPRRRRPKQ